jgi:ATP-dependent Clp protease ATP-binding subunit ClpA
MFSQALIQTITEAFHIARINRHPMVTLKHLLLALTQDVSAVAILVSCETNLEKMTDEISQYVSRPVARVPHLTTSLKPSNVFKRVMQRALLTVQQIHGNRPIIGSDVLFSMLYERHNIVQTWLNNCTNVKLLLKLAKEQYSMIDEPKKVPVNTSLRQYTVSLTDKARLKALSPLIGREKELQRLMITLCRHRKHHPIIIGDAGIGKSAIVEGLASMIVAGKVPEYLASFEIFSLEMGALMAGTKYRGEFEERFQTLIKDCEKLDRCIVLIDDVQTMLGAGATQETSLDAACLLKALMEKKTIRFIGTTTHESYRKMLEKDKVFTRRFFPIMLTEPSVLETYSILKGLKKMLELHHHVRYSLRALKHAAELSARFIQNRCLPDKAIDILDEAGAQKALHGQHTTIDVHDIEQTIADIAHIPIQSLSSSEREQLKGLERQLKLLIFGQDRAIETITAALKVARSGLRDARKPMGCFLLMGPTGVGKTELTQQLANVLSLPLLRLDMSEYMEKHAVSKLLGSPPGYVGYEQNGRLIEMATKTPHAVLLLDEIEKAHHEVLNILLQMMDYGTLTDNMGRKSDFRHMLIIMTSNVGAVKYQKQSVGFHEVRSYEAHAELERTFTPEFRNRLDAVVAFKPLQPGHILNIVNKLLFDVSILLAKKGVDWSITANARRWLAHAGYDVQLGARPLERFIQTAIKEPIANRLLSGALGHGDSIHVALKDNALSFLVKKPAFKRKKVFVV